LSPTRNSETERKKKHQEVIEHSVYRDKTYLYFIILVFLFAMCFFQLFTTIPVFFKEDFHLSVFFIGLVMALNGLIIAFLEMIIIFSLEGRRPALKYISVGVILVSIAFLLLNIRGNFQLLAILYMLTLTFGEIMAMPFMNAYWIGRTLQNNRGQYAALYSVAWATAQTIGPYAGSLVAGDLGYKTLWWAISSICVILAFFYSKLHSRSILQVNPV
jgi:predicted MFS family arabinose efflux permease